MRDQVYQIDENGFLTNIYVVDFNEDGSPLDELPSNFITLRPPDGLYRARWTGVEWVEDKTPEEFEYDRMVESLNPTQEDITNALFEIKVLNTLLEVGLI